MNIKCILILLIFICHINGCTNYLYATNAKVTSVEWKIIYEEDSEYFKLYINLKDEIDMYAGRYFHSSSFRLNENSDVQDAPENALSTLSTMEAQVGHWFYMYQKSDTEISVMYHTVLYPEWLIQDVKEWFCKVKMKNQETPN